jgi:gluconate 2-dehydrogenase gamma chain
MKKSASGDSTSVGPSLHRSEAFPEHIFRALVVLCDHILPADERSGAASDAGVGVLLDFLAGESTDYRRQVLGGITWLSSFCSVRFGCPFLECSTELQSEIVALIAFRQNGVLDPCLVAGIEFFAFLRREVLSAFFTSRIGFADLDYLGNQVLTDFRGCPPLPKRRIFL